MERAGLFFSYQKGTTLKSNGALSAEKKLKYSTINWRLQ
jgi:hypothetical protein